MFGNSFYLIILKIFSSLWKRNLLLEWHWQTIYKSDCLKCGLIIRQFKFSLLFCIFFKILFILFFRKEKGERKTGRETSMCGCLSHALFWGPGLQPRHVPYTGNRTFIDPLISRSALNQWATPARAYSVFLRLKNKNVVRKRNKNCADDINH